MKKRDSIKLYENNEIKITVEELDAFKFIATFWDKEMCLEFDRNVTEHETYGGAVDSAFDFLSDYVDSRSNS